MNKEEKERILKCVMNQIERERIPRRKRRLKQAAALALAGVTIFACGAFTAKVLDLDDKLAARLGASSGEITEAVTDLNTAVEKNGLRIEAKQAVGDGRRVYAVFEVTSLTGQKLDETCGFQNCSAITVEQKGEEKVFGPADEKTVRTGELTCSVTSLDFYGSEVSENGKTLRFEGELIMEKPIYDRKVTICFENFGRWFHIPEDHQKVLFEGEWILEFPLKYEKVARTYTAQAQVPLKSGILRLEQLDLSPISWFIKFGVEEWDSRLETEWDKLPSPKFKMKDGTFAETYTDAASWVENGKDSVGTAEGAFDRAIDFRQVESVILGDAEIPISSMKALKDEKQQP